MKYVRRLIELDTRALCWLADHLGFWRIDVAIDRAHARYLDRIGVWAQHQGLHAHAEAARLGAARWRRWADERVPQHIRAR